MLIYECGNFLTVVSAFNAFYYQTEFIARRWIQMFSVLPSYIKRLTLCEFNYYEIYATALRINHHLCRVNNPDRRGKNTNVFNCRVIEFFHGSR